MINLNLTPERQQKVDELEKRKEELVCERHELRMKESMGMPMDDEELSRASRIDAIIDQVDELIDWMMIVDEDYEFEV